MLKYDFAVITPPPGEFHIKWYQYVKHLVSLVAKGDSQ